MKPNFKGIDSWGDLLAMSVCYALVISMGWMLTHREQFAGFVMGLLP